MLVYGLAHTVNYLHTAFIIYLFLGIGCTLNLFYIEMIVFLAKKFRNIAKRIERTNVNKPIDNRRMSGLIYSYNRTVFELIEMNNFFKVNF